MAEGGCDFGRFRNNREQLPYFFADEDRNLFRDEFRQGYAFMRQLFKDVLFKYGLTELTEHEIFQEPNLDVWPYCPHMCESVIAMSYCNRLKFKIIYEQCFYAETELPFFYIDRVAFSFVTSFYKKGWVDEFLMVCSFFVEFAVFLHANFKQSRADSLSFIFGDVFRYVMREKFVNGGGWLEVKRLARPWWHAYRNYYYNREREMREKGPNARLKYFAEFHSPMPEHIADHLTAVYEVYGYSTEIIVIKEYPEIKLLDCVPLPLRASPICEDDLVPKQESKKDSEREATSEMDTNKKSKPKRKHRKHWKKSSAGHDEIVTGDEVKKDSERGTTGEMDIIKRLSACEIDTEKELSTEEVDTEKELPTEEVDTEKELPTEEVDTKKDLATGEVDTTEELSTGKINTKKSKRKSRKKSKK